MGQKPQVKVTNEEVEKAFHEVAVFLFEQYKKSKLDKAAEQEDAT